jgi:hypothetical protein
MRVYKFIDAKYGLLALSERRLKISTLDNLNDPFELLPFDLRDRRLRAALSSVKEEFGSRRGLLCFSANWHNPVLWAHYAEQHRGVCIGFEIPDDICRSVQYVSKKLQFPKSVSDLGLAYGDALLFTKYKSWAYEQEIRAYVTLEDPSGGRFYKEFDDKLRPAVVIAGARCAHQKADFVTALSRQAEHVRLIKARAGFGVFEIVQDRSQFK